MLPVMDPEYLHMGFARFAADLTLAGESIAFDVVVARHLGFLTELQTAGLKWPSVARMLDAAGARRPDGKPLSADQIRASVSRIKRRRPVERLPVSLQSDHPHSSRTGYARAPAAYVPGPAPFAKPLCSRQVPLSPDLSDAEILAARRRLLGS